jgi:hypothetical protein
MQSIFSSRASIAVFSVPPYFIIINSLYPQFGVIAQIQYYKRIVLKSFEDLEYMETCIRSLSAKEGEGIQNAKLLSEVLQTSLLT